MHEAWLVDAAAWAAVEPYRAAPGAVVADTGAVRWYRTPIAYEGLNGVLWARLDGQDLDAAVGQALAPFRETGVPMQWHLGPTTSPPSLPKALEAAGLARQEEEPGMVADLAVLGPPAPAPAGLEVRWVRDEDGLAAWCCVWAGLPPGTDVGNLVEVRASKALGADPPVPHLLAVLGGTPAGCAAVLVGDGRGGRPPAAWLEDVVTTAALRRRGIGACVTRACLDLARSHGLDRAALTASVDGHRIYRRLGFRERCRVVRYRYPPAG